MDNIESKEALERKLPTVENPESISSDENTASGQMEQPSFAPSQQPSQQPQIATNQTKQEPPAGAVITSTTAVPSTPVSGLSAEDVDLIEKTWVEKAKQIVRETHGDPYSQNKELNKVKAEYIKTRFEKDVKVTE